MAQRVMSYQINDFWRKRGVDIDTFSWVSPSSLTYRESLEVKDTVQTACTLWVCGDCGTDLDPSITVGFRAVIPAQQQGATCRAACGCRRALQCSSGPTSSLEHRQGCGPCTHRTDKLPRGSGSADTCQALLLAVLQLLALQVPASSPRPFPVPTCPLGIPGLPLLPPPLPVCNFG